MKVDQYRVQKFKEYSFLVPAGMDLTDFEDPQKGYLSVFYPYSLEQQEVELETIVSGSEVARAMEDLQNDRLAVVLTVHVLNPEGATEDGID